MSVSLCTFVKNEEHCVGQMIRSVIDYVDEVVVVDTGSTDKTVKVAQEATGGKIFRPYFIGFSDFGKIRTITSHLARKDWVLMLDADEELVNPEQILSLVTIPGYDAYAFPRKRWLDLEKVSQTEREAWPDYQVRLYRNKEEYVWKRELHEFFHGTTVHHSHACVIDHFHDVYKDRKRLRQRTALYTELADKAGVTIEGGHKK